ncbi:MAG: hypothetical protein AB7F22_25265 [Reyranella sp.]|uniref:hypothetical protein n=1 Tax=Reyranella sp. TaxID=1929291 RepID=UPI003D143B9F
MSKRHAQKRAAKAVRRKKLLAERRKSASAATQMSLAAQVRQVAIALDPFLPDKRGAV